LSLKGFHIIFIICAVMITIFYGVWELNYYSYSKTMGHLITAIGSFILAIALSIYGFLVAKKLRRIQNHEKIDFDL